MSIFEPHFCPTCGTELVPRKFDGRKRGYCSECERYTFHIPTPCAGVSVVDGECVLLIERATYPFQDTWAIPGGIIEQDELPDDAAARELREETGVEVSSSDLVLLDANLIDDAPENITSIAINYAVSRADTSGEPRAGDEVTDARFWSLNELRESDETLRPGEGKRMERAIERICAR